MWEAGAAAVAAESLLATCPLADPDIVVVLKVVEVVLLNGRLGQIVRFIGDTAAVAAREEKVARERWRVVPCATKPGPRVRGGKNDELLHPLVTDVVVLCRQW